MALKLRLFCGVCCLYLFSLPLYATSLIENIDEDWKLSDKEVANIELGKIVVRAKSIDDTYIKEINAYLKIKASVADVFALITDYEKLPEFMPNLEHTEVLERSVDGARVNYVLDLPFGVSKRYRLQLTYDVTPPNLRMAWQSVPWAELEPDETIQDTSGYWLLKPINASETLLHYYTKTDPGHVPFGLGWIVEYLTNKTIVELLKNTKERVEEQALKANEGV